MRRVFAYLRTSVSRKHLIQMNYLARKETYDTGVGRKNTRGRGRLCPKKKTTLDTHMKKRMTKGVTPVSSVAGAVRAQGT